MRVDIVDPDTLRPVAHGKIGLLKFVDIANVNSVAAILTGDAGRKFQDGRFEVLGRAPGAEIRGCSLSAERLE
jgi:hypothetical protein